MPSSRRILSLWFPRMGAERLLRLERARSTTAIAVIRETGNTQIIDSLSEAASAAGLSPGQPLRDARALCPDLVTRPSDPKAEAAFLRHLARWAGRYSPWVALAPPDGLAIDLSGCAHLFGGEEALLRQVRADCAEVSLSVCAGIADTHGTAWAVARFHARSAGPLRNGDAIDQEARATRSRAARRRGRGTGEMNESAPRGGSPIVPPGGMRAALAALPVAALRLPDPILEQLARLGLRRIEDLAGQPRGAVARRFGPEIGLRLDQAFGLAPEPLSPIAPDAPFSARLSLPDPIGLEADILAGIDRLLPALCDRLADRGRGARRIVLRLFRCDHTSGQVEVRLARPSDEPIRIRPLLAMRLSDIDAGPGIDAMRLEAPETEVLRKEQGRHPVAAQGGGTADSPAGMAARGPTAPDPLPAKPDAEFPELVSRIGVRVGLEEITRVVPGDSYLPERSGQIIAAAWAFPAEAWQPCTVHPRPLILFPPEPVHLPAGRVATHAPKAAPCEFRWRGRTLVAKDQSQSERICPEWWWDHPDWRSGFRDYWRVEAETGDSIWIYFAHGDTMSAGWFCHGIFG